MPNITKGLTGLKITCNDRLSKKGQLLLSRPHGRWQDFRSAVRIRRSELVFLFFFYLACFWRKRIRLRKELRLLQNLFQQKVIEGDKDFFNIADHDSGTIVRPDCR
jgi:hypothetical protein